MLVNVQANNQVLFKATEDKLTPAFVGSVIRKLGDAQINSLRIDAGCVGLVSCYVRTPDKFCDDWIAALQPQAKPSDWYSGPNGIMMAKIQALRPQDITGAKYYADVAAARTALTNDGGTLIAVQGKGTGAGGSLAPGVPNKNSIKVGPNDTTFNFVVYFSDAKSKTWAYMNAGANESITDVSNQKVILKSDSDVPAGLPGAAQGYPATMYVLIPKP